MGSEGYYNASNDFSIDTSASIFGPISMQPHRLEDVVYAEGWRARLARRLLDVPTFEKYEPDDPRNGLPIEPEWPYNVIARWWHRRRITASPQTGHEPDQNGSIPSGGQP